MSVLAGLISRTRGSVTFEGGVERPPLGTIGLVPQKNVLFPELTCYQTLRLWKAIKPLKHEGGEDDENIEQLLRDCDLGKKIHYNANALSGGQKRKLQLAIGLVGGSKSGLCYDCFSESELTNAYQSYSLMRYARTFCRSNLSHAFSVHFRSRPSIPSGSLAHAHVGAPRQDDCLHYTRTLLLVFRSSSILIDRALSSWTKRIFWQTLLLF